MRARFQGQRRHNLPRSGPFPWKRLIIALVISLLLLFGTLLFILSTGHIISTYWYYVLPPVYIFVGIIIPLFQWLLPITEDAPTHPSQSQQPPSTHPTMPKTTSAPTTPLWNVPYPHNPFFIGRDTLLTQLYDILHSEKAAALTQAISGLGGIGKTQLAVEYAYRNRDKYQAILWGTATTYETLFTDFVALAELLDLPEKDAQDYTITVQAVKHWLETHSRWLLIIDNADDLEIINDFLPTRGNGHIIITTRSQATGTIAQPLEVPKLEPDDGAVFLLHRARIIPTTALLADVSDEDRANARAIAYLLDGLPLALDQAGAYIEETRCTLSDYLTRYQKQRATLLKERGRFSPVHPESVMTTFSLAFKKVQKANPAAADLLRFFAFLSPEAISLDLLLEGAPELGKLLRRVATDPQELEEALSTLYSYSLVRRDTTTNTLYIHRLVQAVLKEEMNKRTQRQWAERTVRAVFRAIPLLDFTAWQRYRQYFLQAIACKAHIEQWQMAFPEAARLLNLAGYYLYEHAQYSEAKPIYQRALIICETALEPDHPITASVLNNMALLYKAQGKYEQAEPLYQRALATGENVLGTHHPDTAAILNNLAMLYNIQGKYEQAEPLLQHALAICEEVSGPYHLSTANCLNNLGGFYKSQGKYEQAELPYQRALTIREKLLGFDHPDTANSLNNLGGLYNAQGKYKQAELFYQKALTIREKAPGPDHPNTANSLKNLAGLYESQGKYEQAEPLYRRALSIREKVLGPDHPDTRIVQKNYADLLQKIKDEREQQS
jgi:tetratricopeptide (TPR) repeat protein